MTSRNVNLICVAQAYQRLFFHDTFADIQRVFQACFKVLI